MLYEKILLIQLSRLLILSLMTGLMRSKAVNSTVAHHRKMIWDIFHRQNPFISTIIVQTKRIQIVCFKILRRRGLLLIAKKQWI